VRSCYHCLGWTTPANNAKISLGAYEDTRSVEDTLLGASAGGTGFDAPVILLMSENVRRKDDMPLICCGDGVVATMRTAADWDRETGRFANVRQERYDENKHGKATVDLSKG